MRRPSVREESYRLAKAYIAAHDNGSLALALADPACAEISTLAALLHACGHSSVSVDDDGQRAEFFVGPTAATATLQLTFENATGQLAGSASVLMDRAYAVLSAIEHELGDAVYLPPGMRRDRVLSVCDRLGVDEDFFQTVLRNSLL